MKKLNCYILISVLMLSVLVPTVYSTPEAGESGILAVAIYPYQTNPQSTYGQQLDVNDAYAYSDTLNVMLNGNVPFASFFDIVIVIRAARDYFSENGTWMLEPANVLIECERLGIEYQYMNKIEFNRNDDYVWFNCYLQGFVIEQDETVLIDKIQFMPSDDGYSQFRHNPVIKQVQNFNRIWHDNNGFNKLGNGDLVLAVTYSDFEFRNIDFCSIYYSKQLFVFRITFEDELEIIRDSEGNIIYEEPGDGFIFLRKSFVDNHIPKIKQLASKGINYKTIEFNSVLWYRIYVPDFNRVYEWKQFTEPTFAEKWYTWGNINSIKFDSKAMYIQQTLDNTGHLGFYINHDSDNSGQPVSISKEYLQSKGINNPVFEWEHTQLSYTENDTHYTIFPEHFTHIGVHEEASGEFWAKFINCDTYTDRKVMGQTLIGDSELIGPGDYQTFKEKIDVITKFRLYLYNGMDISWNFQLKLTDADGDGDHFTLSTTIVSKVAGWYTFNFNNPIAVDFNTTYRIYGAPGTSGVLTWHCRNTNPYANGSASWDSGDDAAIKIYGYRESYSGNRTYGLSTERDVVSQRLIDSVYEADNGIVEFRVPVSTSVDAISEVWNGTTDDHATAVDSRDLITNCTYWFDKANRDVYIGMENLTTFQTINWSVNGTWGAYANISFTRYKDVGEDVSMKGYITDSDGQSLNEVIAYLRVYYENGTLALGPYGWNCTGGNFEMDFSTTTIPAGNYSVDIEFVDPITSMSFKVGEVLYLGVDPPSGIHVASKLHFNFFNNNTGMGLPIESFKVFANNELDLTSGNRLYEGIYNTYTGETVYYNVTDYFDNIIYPNWEVENTEGAGFAAGWWDEDWQYYKTIYLADDTNDYQMLINVSYGAGGDIDTESHCQADFDDIRFIDEDNATVLDYWREYYVASRYARFWVELPADVETDAQILMYYGNAGASTTSHGANTFLYFDDWGADNTSDWWHGRETVAGGSDTDWAILNITGGIGYDKRLRYQTSQKYWVIGTISTRIGFCSDEWDATRQYPDDYVSNRISAADGSTAVKQASETYCEVAGVGLWSSGIVFIDPFAPTTTYIREQNVVSDNVTNFIFTERGSKLSISTESDAGHIPPAADLDDIVFFTYVNADTGFFRHDAPGERLIVGGNRSSNVLYLDWMFLSDFAITEPSISSSSAEVEGSVLTYANYSATNTSVLIISRDQWVDVPINWYAFSVKNMNNSIVWFNMTNATTTYSIYLFPYEPFYFDVLAGEYNLSMRYYNSGTGVYEQTRMTNITIDADYYYVITGYDLRDIIIDIELTNASLNTLMVTIETNLEIVNSTVNTIDVDINTSIILMESNITAIILDVWNQVNLTDTMVDYMNTTVNVNILRVNTTINYINDTVWRNFTYVNQTMNEATVNIITTLDLSEVNLTAINLNVWTALNLTDAMVTYLNNTMWTNLTFMNATINTISSTLSIDFDMLNVTVNYLNNTMWTEFNTVNSNIGAVTTNVRVSIALLETNLTTINLNLWSSINISEAIVTYLNNTIWSNFTGVNVTIDYLNTTIWTEFTLVNSTVNNVNASITSKIILLETNVTAINLNIWSAINVTDAMVTYLNNTIWSGITAINTTIDYVNNTIWTQFIAVNSNIDTAQTTIVNTLILQESNITAVNLNIWSSINISEAMVTYLNNTIWSNLTIIDTTIDNLNNNIWTNLTVIESDIGTLTTSIHTSLILAETNLTAINLNIWSAINITDSIIDYMNSTMLANFSFINTTIDTINSNIWTNFTAIESDIDTVNVAIHSSIDLFETNLTAINLNIWNSINITDAIIDYLNLTMWTNFTTLETDIGALTFNTTINYDIINSSIDTMNSSVTSVMSLFESNVTTLHLDIQSLVNLSEVNITALCTTITNNLVIVDSVIDHLNNSIWANFTLIETTVDDINNNIWTNFTLINTSVNNIDIDTTIAINLMETNLTSLNNNIWNSINLTDSVVDYVNNTIWNRIANVSSNITKINQSITYINETVWNNFTFIGENITHMNLSIITALDLSELNLTSLNLDIWTSLNLTDAMVEYLNNTMWANFSFMNTTINTIDNTLSINFDMLNVTVDYLNNTIWTEFTIINSSVNNINTSITSKIILLETNITAINLNLWSAINLTDAMVTYLNNTIWNEITMVNVTVDYLNNTIWTEFTAINTTINSFNTSITNTMILSESNITAVNLNIWNSINLTDAMVTYLNNTIWNEISAVNTTIDYLNNTIWTNLTLINSDIDALDVSVQTCIDATETNISDIVLNVWTALNITNATIDNLNASIWTNLSFIQSTLNATNLTITNMISFVESNITSLIIHIDNIIDYALMPDAVIWSVNPPIIISIFDVIGMELGQDIWKVCPALNVIATTRNGTFGNWVNSTVLMPSNGTVENGTITILSDIMHIWGNGSIDWVNITWTDNRTTKMNVTYIPGIVDLFGENVTVNASGDIYVRRDTRYNQLKKFYWNIHNSTINDGHIPDRAGWHTTGIEVNNPMDTILYDVYVLIGFSDKTIPDVNTVRVQDVDNDNALLEEGEDFSMTADSVQFRLTGSINASSSRNFVVSYYRSVLDSYYYGFGYRYINSVETNKRYSNNVPFYSYFKCLYVNDKTLTFRGDIFITINMDKITEIDEASVIVYDADNQQQIDSSRLVIGDSFIIISSEIVGDMSPGGGRNFEVYFLEVDYPGADPETFHLNTKIGHLVIDWTPFMIICVILIIPLAYGIISLVITKKGKRTSFQMAITVMSFVVLFIFWVLQSRGY